MGDYRDAMWGSGHCRGAQLVLGWQTVIGTLLIALNCFFGCKEATGCELKKPKPFGECKALCNEAAPTSCVCSSMS